MGRRKQKQELSPLEMLELVMEDWRSRKAAFKVLEQQYEEAKAEWQQGKDAYKKYEAYYHALCSDLISRQQYHTFDEPSEAAADWMQETVQEMTEQVKRSRKALEPEPVAEPKSYLYEIEEIPDIPDTIEPVPYDDWLGDSEAAEVHPLPLAEDIFGEEAEATETADDSSPHPFAKAQKRTRDVFAEIPKKQGRRK